MNPIKSKPARVILSTSELRRVRDLYLQCQSLNTLDRNALVSQEEKNNPSIGRELRALLLADAAHPDQLGESWEPPRLENLTGTFPPAAARHIGRYEILKTLGRGGMAEVYLARMNGPADFTRTVALKRILPEAAKDPTFRKLFEYEAALCSRLSHPNIVQTFDFFAAEGGYALAIEYVNGKNLRDITARLCEQGYSLPVEVAVYVVAQVAAALQYAYFGRDPVTGKTLGVVHRDISPKNVMLSYAGQVKLLDFGIARAFDRGTLTTTGQMRGTVSYMAPEIVTGGVVDGRTDIFSLCCVFFELLTGSRLFDAPDLIAAIREIEQCSIPPEVLPTIGIDPELIRILSRGLRKNPEERYPSAKELQTDLEKFLDRVSPGFSESDVSQFILHWFETEYRSERLEMEALSTNSSPKVSDENAPVPLVIPPLPASRRKKASARKYIGFLSLIALGIATWMGWKYQSVVSVFIPSPVESREVATKAPASSIDSKESLPPPTSVPSTALSTDPQTNCASFVRKHCPESSNPVSFRLCLFNHQSILFSDCLQKLRTDPMMNHCGKELARFCSKETDLASVKACFARNSASLSKGCAEFTKSIASRTGRRR